MRQSKIDIPGTTLDFASVFTRGTAPDVPTGILLLVLLAAAVVSIPTVTWRYFGLFTTLVHELGHAFAALLTGRLVTGIRIHRNHAGTASSVGRRGFSAVFSGFFGYPTPAIVGTVLIWCTYEGFASVALLVGAVVIVLTLLFIRNAFGVLVVTVCAAISGVLWYYGSADLQGYFLLVLGVSLLVGAVRGWATVVGVHVRRRSELATSDAWLLYRATGIPSPVWLLLFAAVIAGGVWLTAGEILSK